MKKLFLSLLLILFVVLGTSAQESSGNSVTRDALSGGFGLGSMIAVVASWDRNRSVLFAFFAGIFSWIYVLYYLLTRTKEERNRK